MTDPQTPATEAGRRLLAAANGPGNITARKVADAIPIIEAEARADLQKQLDEAYERLADEGYKDGIRLAEAVNEVTGRREELAYQLGASEGRADALRTGTERMEAWAGAVLRLIAVAPIEDIINETGIAWSGHSTPPERKAIRERARAVVVDWLARDLAILDPEAAP